MSRRDDERGIAMVTAILTSAVVLVLSMVAISLARHSTESTGFDRRRTQAVHAAEAGVNRAMGLIQSSEPAALPCAIGPEALSSEPPVSYTVAITYYTAYPPSAGVELPCPLAPSARPAAAHLSATSQTATAGSPSRTVEAQVRLSPIIGSLRSTIFAESGLAVANRLIVSGNTGPDGDVYTNGDFACANNTTIEGSAVAQGAAALSQSCTVLVDG
ncbi:MAG: hypothetical protein ACRD0M_02625, partial [Acidimicrobiales bacterium]